MMTLRKIIHAILWTKRRLFNPEIGEEKRLMILRKFIHEEDVCLDVGAHGGSWSVPLANIVKKGRVYAFEALPYYSQVLKITITLLKKKNITVFNNAIVDVNCKINIVWKDSQGKRLTGLTHIAGTGEKYIEPCIVKGITLDSFIANEPGLKRISFVKMDIEGAELLALRGATKLIQNSRPVFFLEIDDDYCRRYNYTANDVFIFLRKFNYKAFLINDEEKLLQVDACEYSGKGDVLFVPEEKQISPYH